MFTLYGRLGELKGALRDMKDKKGFQDNSIEMIHMGSVAHLAFLQGASSKALLCIYTLFG